MAFCNSGLFRYIFSPINAIQAMPYDSSYGCEWVTVKETPGWNSNQKDEWVRSKEAYDIARRMGWPKSMLCQYSYYAAYCAIPDPTFMIAYPYEGTTPGGKVRLGVGIYIGPCGQQPNVNGNFDYITNPECCTPIDARACRLFPLETTVPIKVYLKNPSGSFRLYKTVNAGASIVWEEDYTCEEAGTWSVRYEFAGTTSYAASSAQLDFSVVFCTADEYYECYSGQNILVRRCVGGEWVDVIGATCPTVQKQMAMTVDVTGINANGDGRDPCVVSDTIRAQITGCSADGVSVYAPFTIELQKPGEITWTLVRRAVLGDYPGSHIVDVPADKVGIYKFRFTALTHMLYVDPVYGGGTQFNQVQVTDTIQVNPCLDGMLSGPKVCGDGSTIYQYTCQSGQWHETFNVCPDEACTGPEYVTCCDGSQVMKYDCINGEKVPTHYDCPTANQCTAPVYKDCPLGGYILEKDCSNGCLVPTGFKCPECDRDRVVQCTDGTLVTTRKCDVNGFWDTTFTPQTCTAPPLDWKIIAIGGGLLAVGYLMLTRRE